MTRQQLQLSKPAYRPDIDGLRAVAVLGVLVFHAFPDRLSGGFIGVDIFFVISGYLISTIIYTNLNANTFSFYEFYVRRIKRIFPALTLVLLICYVLGWFALFPDEYKQLGKHIAAGVFFVSNFVLWTEAGYFDTSADLKPLLHLWSLGIEEQFYILWPVFLYFLWRKKIDFIKYITALIIISFILNLYYIRNDTIIAFFSPLTRFWELLIGSLLAWIHFKKPDQINNAIFQLKIFRFHSFLFQNILSILGALLILYGFFNINKNASFPGAWALIPVSGALLLIAAGPAAWVNRFALSNRVAVWFGLISFPLYLWHWPLLAFARIIESGEPDRIVRFGVVVVSIALAWLTYVLVEKPIRQLLKPTPIIPALVVGMVFLGALGLHTFLNDGHKTRLTIKNYVNNKNELTRSHAIDNECLKFIDNPNPLFPYCRFTNSNSEETIAIIGDSHAHVAYPGIVELLKNKKINSVLLANSGCPPFLKISHGNNSIEKQACNNRIEQLLDIVVKRKEIKKVFVFTRGITYSTGTEPMTGLNNVINKNTIPLDDFIYAAQKTFDYLSTNGKLVYYITENPELNYSSESCLTRPLKLTTKDCSVNKSEVLARQIDYRAAFLRMKNVTIIDSLEVFCPGSKCLAFDASGVLLYADDDHLSVAGSRFQAERLLMPYLK